MKSGPLNTTVKLRGVGGVNSRLLCPCWLLTILLLKSYAGESGF